MSEELALNEIVQIALGGIDFNSVNISLLYTIIDLLLKKLNCENEKVTVNGIVAESLQDLLCMSSTGPSLSIGGDKIKMPLKLFEELDKVEKQIEKLETNLAEHIENAEHAKNLMKNKSDSDKADLGIIPCALLCNVEQSSDMASALLRNKWFFRQLNEHIKRSFVCPFHNLDKKLVQLEKNIEKFNEGCAVANKRIDKVDDLFYDLLNFQTTMKENYKEFMTTMEEIQEVMDSKVNNLEMPPLKRAIFLMQRRLANEANFLSYIKTKPRALLSIANPVVAEKVSRSIIKRFLLEPKLEEKCGCDKLTTHSKLKERFELIDTNDVWRRSTVESFRGSRKSFAAKVSKK